MNSFSIADLTFACNCKYEYAKSILKDYENLGGKNPLFSIITKEDELESVWKERNLTYPYCEAGLIFDKFVNALIDNDGLILHASAIAVDGDAYVFLAPSGVGKSTHVKIWADYFKDRAIIINDDKPALRKVGNDFYVYGTPWRGKHKRGSNVKFKLKAVCVLKRGANNTVCKRDFLDCAKILLNQTARPKSTLQMDKLINTINELINKAEFYEVRCNTSSSAAKEIYGQINGGNCED